jgi:hypothetical protein
LKINDDNSRIRIQDPDPLVRGMDPRIRIHPKMSWIRNTEKNDEDLRHRILRIPPRPLSPYLGQRWLASLVILCGCNRSYNITVSSYSVLSYIGHHILYSNNGDRVELKAKEEKNNRRHKQTEP